MKTLIIAMLMLLTAKSFAVDIFGNYITYGVGSSSCGSVVVESRKNNFRYKNMQIWVTGYLTAINAKRFGGVSILQSTDFESAMLWIRNYCQENPLKDLAYATELLYLELRDK